MSNFRFTCLKWVSLVNFNDAVNWKTKIEKEVMFNDSKMMDANKSKTINFVCLFFLACYLN